MRNVVTLTGTAEARYATVGAGDARDCSRLGEPEEATKAIYFLCTDQSSYVNGAELPIDRGQHA